MFFLSTMTKLVAFLLLPPMVFAVSAFAFAAPLGGALRLTQQTGAHTRNTSTSKSKIGEMLPSRMHKRVKLTKAATHRLPKLGANATQGNKGGKGQPLQVGIARTLALDPTMQGVWFDLGNAGRAMLLGIVSEGAAQLRVQFTATDLPTGAKLFVRSMNNTDEVYGAFEGRGALGNGEFWTPPVRGDSIVIEYIDPHLAKGSARRKKIVPFRIAQVSHIFRD